MKQTVLVLAAWLLAAACQAQIQWLTAGPTLAGALEQAWSRHPQAQAFSAWESEARARIELAAALTPSAPKMSIANANDRLNAAAGKDAWELELAVPLWLPGQRAAQGWEAGSAHADVAARRAALRLQLASELREAWWAVAMARNAMAQATHREASAKTLQADVQRRLKAGELARMEANLATLEQLSAESELLEAQATLRQVELTYRTLTGTDAPTQLVDEAAQTPAPNTMPHPQSHPQLLAAQAQAQLAQARVGVAQQTGRDAPELALRWVRERSDINAAYAESVGIKLTVPFGSSARQRQANASALGESLQADAELVRTQQRLEQDVARALRDEQTTQLQLARAQERLALTHDNMRLSEKAFALGESDLASLLRARAVAFEAQAHLDRQRIARAASISRLNQSMGLLP